MESLPPETSARTEYICGIFKSRRKGVKERERDGELIQSEEVDFAFKISSQRDIYMCNLFSQLY